MIKTSVKFLIKIYLYLLLVTKGIATRSKKLLVAPGISIYL